MTQHIIGLDLSLRASGLARADGTTAVVSSPLSDLDRLVHLRDQIDSECLEADLIVLEDYAFASKYGHVHEIGELGGLVKVRLIMERSHSVALVKPASVKKFATDKGNANKTAMVVAAYKAAKQEFANDNECDAWWLRQMGLYRAGASEVLKTAYRDEAVSKIDWPDPWLLKLEGTHA